MKSFNEKTSYSILGGYICTIYVRPTHCLDDILECKKYLRHKLNTPNIIFRPVVKVKEYG